MRKRLSILVFAMLVGRALAGDGGPIDTVNALAALDAIEDQVRIFDTTPTPLMRKYFSASFNQVWTTAMKHNKDFPVFDADPLTGTQGGGGIKSLSAEMAGPNRVVSTMQLQHGPDQTIEFRMLHTPTGEWLINDIVYVRRGESLREVLGRADR